MRSRSLLTSISADFNFNCKISLCKLTPYVLFDRPNKQQFLHIKIKGVFAVIFASGRVLIQNARNTSSVQNAVDSLCQLLEIKERPHIQFSDYCMKTTLPNGINISQFFEFLQSAPETSTVVFKPHLNAVHWVGKEKPARIYIDSLGSITTTNNSSKEGAFISLRFMKLLLKHVSITLILLRYEFA